MPQRSVRQYTEVGSSLSLSCNYQLEGSSLYSIKWYRDNMEFFRFTPSGTNLTQSSLPSISLVPFQLHAPKLFVFYTMLISPLILFYQFLAG
jgi:hypothetical protein